VVEERERKYQKDEYPQLERGLLFVTAGIVGIAEICSAGSPRLNKSSNGLRPLLSMTKKAPVPGKARACPGLA
jgi:hypothetical protein